MASTCRIIARENLIVLLEVFDRNWRFDRN
jgi:hypothetical protein